jgi:hypothetical protein
MIERPTSPLGLALPRARAEQLGDVDDAGLWPEQWWLPNAVPDLCTSPTLAAIALHSDNRGHAPRGAGERR